MNDFIKSCGKWFEYCASITSNNNVKTPVVAGIALENNSLSKAFFFIRINNNIVGCFAINCFFKYVTNNSTLSIVLFMFNNSCVDLEFQNEKACQIITGQIGVCTHISQLGNEKFHEENLLFLTKFSGRKLNLLKNKEVKPYMPLGENLDARNTWIKRTDYQNICYYTSLSTLPILIYTWNIAQRAPEENTYESAKHIFQTDALFIALVLQEIDFSAKAVILGGSELRQKWNETFDKSSKENGYETIFEDSLGGVFVRYMKKKNFPFSIEISNQDTIRLGLGGMTANKSAIITKFRISNATFAFVGCHLTPHNPNYEERNQQMIELLNHLNAMGEADYTIIFGDLNYRVDLPYEQAVDLCAKGDIKTLLENEQLGRFLSTEPLYKDFHEQKIDFLPTYKFDSGSNIYDTSKKMRVPSWTDRILIKVGSKRNSVGLTDTLKFETDVLRDTELPIEFSGPSYFSIEDPPKNYPIEPKYLEYKSYPDIIFSDHRPVQSYVKFPIPVVDQERLKTFRMIQMKRLDEINGLSIPKCKVEPSKIEKTGPTKVALTNTSFNPVDWKYGFVPKGVSVEPKSGTIQPSMTQEVVITVDEFTPESHFVTLDVKNGSPITIEFPLSKQKAAESQAASANSSESQTTAAATSATTTTAAAAANSSESQAETSATTTAANSSESQTAAAATTTAANSSESQTAAAATTTAANSSESQAETSATTTAANSSESQAAAAAANDSATADQPVKESTNENLNANQADQTAASANDSPTAAQEPPANVSKEDGEVPIANQAESVADSPPSSAPPSSDANKDPAAINDAAHPDESKQTDQASNSTSDNATSSNNTENSNNSLENQSNE